MCRWATFECRNTKAAVTSSVCRGDVVRQPKYAPNLLSMLGRVFETAPPTLPAIPIIANIFVVLLYNGFTLMTRQREDARPSSIDPRAPNREATRVISLIKPPVTTRPMIASQMLTVNPSEQDQSRSCCIVCRCQCFFIGSLYPIAHA